LISLDTSKNKVFNGFTQQENDMTNDININDTVRSFDFSSMPGGLDIEGKDACFIEGIVEGFTEVEGCMRYDIAATRRVFNGVEKDIEQDLRVYPPLNGTPTMMGRICNGVFQIEAAENRKAAFMAEKRESLEIVF
jgi:hypothetical protein